MSTHAKSQLICRDKFLVAKKFTPKKLSQIIKNHQKIGNPVSVKRNLAQSIQNHRQGQANLVKIQHFIIIYPKFYRISSGFDDFKSENTEFIQSILAFLTNIKSVWAQLHTSTSWEESQHCSLGHQGVQALMDHNCPYHLILVDISSGEAFCCLTHQEEQMD